MSKTMKVYLAGGMHTNWQDKVMGELENKDVVFYNPCNKNGVKYNPEKGEQMSFEEFIGWDVHHIRNCDIVFVYGEKDNPGVGYMMEAAYAKGLGKTVVAVVEEDNKHIPTRYIDFMKPLADVYFRSFSDGVKFLSSLVQH